MKGRFEVIIIIGNIFICIENRCEYTNKQLELVGENNKMTFKVAARKTQKLGAFLYTCNIISSTKTLSNHPIQH